MRILYPSSVGSVQAINNSNSNVNNINNNNNYNNSNSNNNNNNNRTNSTLHHYNHNNTSSSSSSTTLLNENINSIIEEENNIIVSNFITSALSSSSSSSLPLTIDRSTSESFQNRTDPKDTIIYTNLNRTNDNGNNNNHNVNSETFLKEVNTSSSSYNPCIQPQLQQHQQQQQQQQQYNRNQRQIQSNQNRIKPQNSLFNKNSDDNINLTITPNRNSNKLSSSSSTVKSNYCMRNNQNRNQKQQPTIIIENNQNNINNNNNYNRNCNIHKNLIYSNTINDNINEINDKEINNLNISNCCNNLNQICNINKTKITTESTLLTTPSSSSPATPRSTSPRQKSNDNGNKYNSNEVNDDENNTKNIYEENLNNLKLSNPNSITNECFSSKVLSESAKTESEFKLNKNQISISNENNLDFDTDLNNTTAIKSENEKDELDIKIKNESNRLNNVDLSCNNEKLNDHDTKFLDCNNTNAKQIIIIDDTHETQLNSIQIESTSSNKTDFSVITKKDIEKTKLKIEITDLSKRDFKKNHDKLDLKVNLESLQSNIEYKNNYDKLSSDKKHQHLDYRYTEERERTSSNSNISEKIYQSYTGSGSDRNSRNNSSSESSPDDSLMEDEDQYSPSQSSCASLNSPSDLLNYPRGIINPNYPGFQHLAHTLSEHFVHHQQQSSDADDSDLSEFEVELSVDGLYENFSTNLPTINSVNNNNNNNNNNNHHHNNNNNNTANTKTNTNIIQANNNNQYNDRYSFQDRNEEISSLSHRKLSPQSNDIVSMTSAKKEINFNSQTIIKDKNSINLNDEKVMKIPEIQILSNDTARITTTSSIATSDNSSNLNKECNYGNENQNANRISKENSNSGNETLAKKCNEDKHIYNVTIKNNEITLNCEQKRNKVCDTITKDISCDLDTYLKKYETLTDIKITGQQNTHKKNIRMHENLKTKINDDVNNENDDICSGIGDNLKNNDIIDYDDDNDGEDGRNCPTPDILIKNDKIRLRHRKSSENRPDLLRNVSPNPELSYHSDHLINNNTKIAKKINLHNNDMNDKNTNKIYGDENEGDDEDEDGCDDIKIIKSRISVPDNIPIRIENQKPSEKDDLLSTYSITPVDIVGDFGGEIEREFGLIVSGYNTTLLCRDCSPLSNSEHERKLTMQKMADAILSDGQEEIALSRTANTIYNRSSPTSSSIQLIKNSACNILSSSSSSSSSSSLLSSGEEKQIKNHQNTLHNKEKNLNQIEKKISDLQKHPHEKSLNLYSSKIITKNSITNNIDHNNIECSEIISCSSVEKQIPTAIVKPKYQKSSYDDRQLPPIGIGYTIDSKMKNSYYSNSSYLSGGNNGNYNDSINRSRKTQLQQQNQQKQIENGGLNIDYRNSRHTKKFISRDKLTNSRRYDKDRDNTTSSSSNNSVVAIVTPRKKDKMEIGNNSEKIFCENGNNSGIENINNNNNCITNGINNNNNVPITTTTTTTLAVASGVKQKQQCYQQRDNLNSTKDKKHSTTTASFDVYNIETALPVIDLEAIENHLKKAKEEERKRRNDREEIRRRLAMGAEDDYFSKIVNADRPGRKPSLQSRLQSGMNLQICFMNEASSDTESPSSDSETCPKLSKCTTNYSSSSRYNSSSLNSAHPYNSRPLSVSISNTANNNNNNNNKRSSSSSLSQTRPSTLSLGPPIPESHIGESDFFTKQARLQIEARMALAQAKDMAHMQMEIERQKQKQSPITEIIRNSLEKVGVPFPPEKRRVSRQMLTDMNIAQLQIIVNELHTQIERLNEKLVQYLMERDDLHMSQDSMLVDIEDLTRYLGAKEQSRVDERANKNKSATITTTTTTSTGTNKNYSNNAHLISSCIKSSDKQNKSNITSSTGTQQQTQSKFQRIASLVKK